MKKLALAVSAAALALAGAAYAAQDMPPPPPGAHGMDPMGDKVVSRAEAQDMAGKMFDHMDANHDGKLDKADREARELEHFRKLDTDGNGSISQAEFLAAHSGGPGRPGGASPAGAPQMDHKAMGHRGMKHDGMGQGRMGPGGHDMMAGMILRRADADHDSAVTRAEFTSAMLTHFDQVDANHDGKVTPDERKAAMKAMRGKMKGMRGKGHHDGAMGDGPPPPPPAN